MSKEELNTIYQIRHNSKDFFNRLQFYSTEKSGDDKSYKALANLLNKDKSFDLCLGFIENATPDVNIFSLIKSVRHLFPYLKHKEESLIKFFKICYEKMKNDYYFFKQFDLFKTTIEYQPQLANKILPTLLSINEEFVVNYISVIYKLLENTDFQKTYNNLILETGNKLMFPLASIIISLSKMNFFENGMRELAEETLVKFKKLNELNINCSVVIDAIVLGLKPFINKGLGAELLLVSISKSGELSTSYQVSKLLDELCSENCTSNWYNEILYHFTSIGVENRNIIRNLDFVFCTIIDKENDIKTFEKFIHKWLLESDIGESKYPIYKIWELSFNKILLEPKNLAKIITRLFNKNQAIFHITASELTTHNSSSSGTKLLLDPETLEKLDFSAIRFICAKILGYVITCEDQFYLLYSIIQHFNDNEDVCDLICDIYQNMLGRDYLHSTIELLEKAINNTESQSSLHVSKIGIVIKNLKHIETTFKSLQNLNEFSPRESQLMTVSLEESRVMEKLSESSHKQSFISRIPTTPIKYGKGWFSFYNGEYTKVSYLSTISTSIEIPRTEIDQPVNSSLIKFRLQNKTR